MDEMSPRQKVAAVEKVRRLEQDLSGGDAAGVVAEINELRHALGWLEIGSDGQWRWPTPVSNAL
jgi:hypothetical protein